jgi:hypothetical protein
VYLICHALKSLIGMFFLSEKEYQTEQEARMADALLNAQYVNDIRQNKAGFNFLDRDNLNKALGNAFVLAVKGNAEDLLAELVDIFLEKYSNDHPWSDDTWHNVLFYAGAEKFWWLDPQICAKPAFGEKIRKVLLQKKNLSASSCHGAQDCAKVIEQIVMNKDRTPDGKTLRKLLNVAINSDRVVLQQQALVFLFNHRSALKPGEFLEILAKELPGRKERLYVNVAAYVCENSFFVSGDGKSSANNEALSTSLKWCRNNGASAADFYQLLFPEPIGETDKPWWLSLAGSSPSLIKILVEHNFLLHASDIGAIDSKDLDKLIAYGERIIGKKNDDPIPA